MNFCCIRNIKRDFYPTSFCFFNFALNCLCLQLPIDYFGRNKKFFCLNQMSNFKQHGWDNAKGAKLCNCQVEITFHKMFSPKIGLLLYQTEIISLLLYVIALAQGRNKLDISSSIHFKMFLRSLSMPFFPWLN